MSSESNSTSRGQWMALAAAILGWLFDGFEMGLFPVVMKPLLRDLLGTSDEKIIGTWEGVMHAGFLIGAATGGVLFGWLGDRIGRVRAMSLSVLTFAIFSGLCGFGNSAGMVLLFRFIASLGMGGEWSLGVSLVMEIWPGRSRAWLAGVIGAASNVGFVLVALVSMALAPVVTSIGHFLVTLGLGEETVAKLTSNSGWRLLLMVSSFPALLTFFIRIFVPESKKWQDENARGATSNWAAKDLWGVVIGCVGPLFMVWTYATDKPFWVQMGSLAVGLVAALVGYTYPVRRFLSRSSELSIPAREINRRMYVGALLSGIALLATWGAIQRAPSWANDVRKAELAAIDPSLPEAEKKAQEAANNLQLSYARGWTQVATGMGAIFGTIIAALMGDKFGRRMTYAILCAASLASALLFFQGNSHFDSKFLVTAFLAGGVTASFYGWLPLYLPELFPTKVRAVGQGFAFNFGRILSGAGSLYIGYLIKEKFNGEYPAACSWLSLIYVLGFFAIWLAPETKGQPLPE
jgi:SHS family sialic acid transporter-like MFS transporter